MTKEIVPGVVTIYSLMNLFVGHAWTCVTYEHRAHNGHLGRVHTTVEMTGRIFKMELLDVEKLSKEFPADIDGAPFVLWLKDVSRPSHDFEPMDRLAPEMTVTFYGRRVQPTLHPVVVRRRLKRL